MYTFSVGNREIFQNKNSYRHQKCHRLYNILMESHCVVLYYLRSFYSIYFIYNIAIVLADGSSIKLFILYTARFFYIRTYTVICITPVNVVYIFFFFLNLMLLIFLFIFLFFRLFGGWISFHDDDDVISPAGKQTLNKKKSRWKSSVCVFISSLFPRKNKKLCSKMQFFSSIFLLFIYYIFRHTYKLPLMLDIYITLQFSTSVSDYMTTTMLFLLFHRKSMASPQKEKTLGGSLYTFTAYNSSVSQSVAINVGNLLYLNRRRNYGRRRREFISSKYYNSIDIQHFGHRL